MKQMQTSHVSIVIPNWNGAILLRKHLPFVVANSDDAQIIVADDASDDDSVLWIRKHYPKIIIVENSKRQGFAGNVNSGVLAANREIVVLLNTDVRPESGFITPLTRHFSDPNVFAVGCLEKSHEKNGIVLRGRGCARWEKGYFIHSRGEVDAHDTAWVSGGSGAFRKSIWHKLGGMDTLYNPFYWEDIDISYRALKAGYTLVFEPTSIVHHYHEQGKIKRVFSPSQVAQIVYRNQFIFIWKNLTYFPYMLEHAFWTPIRLVQTFFTGKPQMIAGYVSACLRLPRIICKRFALCSYWKRTDTEIFN